MKRSIGITFALFVLVGSIVEVRAEQKCSELTEFVDFLHKNDKQHTVIRAGQIGAIVAFFEGNGATLSSEPDFALIVDLPDRGLTLIAFGSGEKVCDFFMLPAQIAQTLVSGA